ncbi:MAG: C40 family peptidase [Desulfitobacteriaceae bacterium]
MVLATGQKWLGVLVLSGLLLSSSIPVATAHFQATGDQVPVFKQLQVTSNKVPSGTYAQVVRKQFNWTTVAEIPVVKSLTAVNDSKAEAAKPATKSVQTASASSTTVSRGSADNSVLINHALSLQGIRYVFGGTSRNGFDCSGFTQYVFAGSELSLPRTSFAQFTTGTSVNRQQLLQGDLVFFTTYQKGASHVGIYIGGGNFVHASIKGVKISSLNESFYNSHYLGARRVR